MSDRYTSSINVYLTILKGNLIWPKIQLQQYILYLFSYWFYKDKFFPSDQNRSSFLCSDVNGSRCKWYQTAICDILYSVIQVWLFLSFCQNSWTNLHVYDVDKLSNPINSFIKGFYEIIHLFLNMFSVKIPVITQICTL